MAAFLSLISRLFGADGSTTKPPPADIYVNLRSQALRLTAEQIGAKTTDPVLAVLMETSYPNAIVTLVSVADGAASLYFSTGGGIIGAGENAAPKAASLELITTAASHVKSLAKTNTTPLPKEGFTRFYFVTNAGILTAEAKERELGENRHALSPLFHTAHALIGAIRVTEEQRAKKE